MSLEWNIDKDILNILEYIEYIYIEYIAKWLAV